MSGAVGVARYGDHTAREVGQQQVRQREVPEVVGAELQLESVARAPERRNEHAGIVDEHTDVAPPVLRERAHRGEIGEVEVSHFGGTLDRGRGIRPSALVSHGEYDVGAVEGERADGFESDAAVASGDDDGRAGQVGHSLDGPDGIGGGVDGHDATFR